MRIWFWSFVILSACGVENEALCEKYLTPYPDLISQRVETMRNTHLVQGGKAYAAGDHEQAIEFFEKYSSTYTNDGTAYFYKAMSQLQLGRPYEAELTLDKLEGLSEKNFADQADYYNIVCLICSEQPARAVQLARDISTKEHHSYKAEIASIIKDLLL